MARKLTERREAVVAFDRWRRSRIFSLVLLNALLIPRNICAQPAMTNPEPEFDCVIEPQQLVKLASPVVGVIGRLDVDRGDIVHKGQILGKLEDDVEQADVALARAKATNDFPIKSIQARLTFLRRKHERADMLVSRNVAAQSTLDEAESDANVAEHQLKEAELTLQVAQLELNHAEAALRHRILQSPVDGVVVERLLLPGEYRNEQSPILTIAQIDPLRVEVFVPIRYYGKIRVGSEGKVRPEEPIGGSYSAAVLMVDRVMDAASGTFGVRLALPNPNLALPAGMRCKVTFGLGSVPTVAPKETLIEPSVADPTTTEAIKLPPSQPIPTMPPTTPPPTGNQLFASPPVATDGELQVTLPAAPLRATASDNEPPPTPPAATIAIGNLPLPIPSAAMSPADSLSLLTPPGATPSPPAIGNESQPNWSPSNPSAATLAPAAPDRIPLPISRGSRRPASTARNLAPTSRNLR
jgi:RND family efflux transporter MFP subunit